MSVCGFVCQDVTYWETLLHSTDFVNGEGREFNIICISTSAGHAKRFDVTCGDGNNDDDDDDDKDAIGWLCL